MAKTVLQVKNLSKQIGKKTIIRNVNFDIFEGEVFGLIGPNGAGKTTVIRSIVNLISRSSGTIMVNGHDISIAYKEAISEVGAIIENPEFYMYMSGWDNLKQYARMSRKSISDDDINAVVAQVKLTEAIQQKVRTYSLGMRQRLGLAQALLHKPTILILDEPTNGLDPQGMADFRDIIRAVSQQGTAVLISSHLLSEIEQFTDRFAILEKGEVTHVEAIAVTTVGQPNRYLFQVGAGAAAVAVLQGLNYAAQLVEENVLMVELTEADVPGVVRELVTAGTDIFAVQVKKGSLEERFFELTEGGSR